MRRLLCMTVLCVVAACSDSINAPEPISLPGIWVLQTINGNPLPFLIVESATEQAEIVSGSLTFEGSGNFSQSTTIRTTTNGQVATQTDLDGGTFVLDRTQVTFTFTSDNATATGTVDGNTLTFSAQGGNFVYTKP